MLKNWAKMFFVGHVMRKKWDNMVKIIIERVVKSLRKTNG